MFIAAVAVVVVMAITISCDVNANVAVHVILAIMSWVGKCVVMLRNCFGCIDTTVADAADTKHADASDVSICNIPVSVIFVFDFLTISDAAIETPSTFDKHMIRLCVAAATK